MITNGNSGAYMDTHQDYLPDEFEGRSKSRRSARFEENISSERDRVEEVHSSVAMVLTRYRDKFACEEF